MVTIKRRPINYRPTLFLFLIIGILSAWLLDISTTAIMNDLVLFNGLWELSPALGYHIGLFGLLGSISILSALGYHISEQVNIHE